MIAGSTPICARRKCKWSELATYRQRERERERERGERRERERDREREREKERERRTLPTNRKKENNIARGMNLLGYEG